MKILIITMDVGGNAPGIVFEKLIFGLSQFNEVDVITANCTPSIALSMVGKVQTITYIDLHPRVKKMLIGSFGVNHMDIHWAYKVKKQCAQTIHTYDIVFSFLSYHHYAALIAGKMISDYFNKKFAVYSVDAIPAPLGWNVDNLYFRGCKKLIRNYLSNVDAFFSANEIMLNYQTTLFTAKKNIILDVVFNPTLAGEQHFKQSNEYIFLYTGGIYGVRKVEYILRALCLLLKEYPSAKLHFVGSVISEIAMNGMSELEREAVKCFPRTVDLAPHYQSSFALLDIDADIENDVFLSSKITNYLSINRPIICETGLNSPSRSIFYNIPSILQCGHDPLELYRAMKQLIENPITDFSDRRLVRNEFKIETVVHKLSNSLLKLTQ